MGNNNPKQKESESYSSTEDSKRRQVKFQEINTNASYSLFGKSFISLNSQQSVCSVSRPWSRVSRRRWKESTLTLPLIEQNCLACLAIRELFFTVIEEVASGAFGKVYKVHCSEDNKEYALKVLSKSKIIKENAVNQVKEEVQIQNACGHHTFIVNSPFHWQTRKKLFIVSDFINNGELYKLLSTYQQLPTELVKLYVAQLALALDFLHNAGVIYRDLKPENILLDHNENCHITDFGLSKWLSYGNKTKTFCGTPRYMGMLIF
ncbi:g protein-coupled receptor kinase/ribosomal protein s6 kinase [Holotrichia oblita]|uniref:G protein-coupled receptor kinase/ribosomal protein s6 kinase n=1 Tax=Holotrichia oblita TaxID=644536 RepID=A0ACB9SMG7_HOLOL|nr:g protein-coupled receptor kinase/ribosomal protein s6 kinase [Holotrichia oblita]